MNRKISVIAILLLTLFVACEKDGELIHIAGLESSDLVASQTNLVLEKDSAAATALRLTWSKSALNISDTTMGIPNSIPMMRMEVSTSESFANAREIAAENYVKTFSYIELNTLATELGFEPFVASKLYFRIKAQLGRNTDFVYSNAATVQVTTYTIDMSLAFMLDSKREDTGRAVWSPNSDGEYKGFIGTTSWYNFFLLEGDGAVWGNYAVDGYAFVMDNENVASIWNFWFPGQTGCYYTTFSTKSKEWTATLIPTLSLSGDVTAEMNFIRNEMTWMASFTTTTANATFSIGGTSALYNSTTNTDDAAAIQGTVTFAPGGGNEVLYKQNGNFTVPGAAGDYTIKINLSDPKAWTYEITAGSVVIEDPISNFLYLPGVDDGISGNWTFDNYLTLLNPDDSTFAGVVNVNSQWGYQMGLEADNWDDVYKMTSGDAYAGTLGYKTGENLAAPSPGLYLINADLKNKTYALTSVEKVYYTGINDDWSLTQMTASSKVGVYVANINISKASEWGFQIFVDDQWKNKFGGKDGALVFGGANITDDKNLAAGSYTLIVDLVNNAYFITEKQIYVTGLNDVWDFTSVVLPETTPGVFSGKATISSNTPWGYNLLLYNNNWNIKIGGSQDALVLGGANITASWYGTNGTYTMTVDLINRKVTVQ